MQRANLCLVVAVIVILCPLFLAAGVSNFISYQGRLTTPAGAAVADGSYQLSFNISDSPTSTAFYESGQVTVAVTNGLFSVNIGAPPMSALPYQLWDYPNLYLGIAVGSDPEMSPRTPFGTSVYAFRAANADTAELARSVRIGDSTMIADAVGVRIGDATQPGDYTLVHLQRTWNTPLTRRGMYIYAHNAGSGGINGMQIDASTAAGQPNDVTGIVVNAYGDGPNRTAIYGVAGTAGGSTGSSFGVLGSAGVGTDVYGVFGAANTGTNCYGVYGYALAQPNSYAGYFSGNVSVTGTLSKGGGAFKIDHPLDPANKYLQHSFVESPDMLNIYNGNVILDADGRAVVSMPGYFEALNREFRYQLTAIGAPGPDLFVASEMQNNEFVIAGGKPGMKVSWQVTGVRKDPYAETNRIVVEVEKLGKERGKYLHPEAYDLPEEAAVDSSQREIAHSTSKR